MSIIIVLKKYYNLYTFLLFVQTDVNECALRTDNCAHLQPHGTPIATCINTLGSYQCHCKDGFAGNGFTCSGNQTLHTP